MARYAERIMNSLRIHVGDLRGRARLRDSIEQHVIPDPPPLPTGCCPQCFHYEWTFIGRQWELRRTCPLACDHGHHAAVETTALESVPA